MTNEEIIRKADEALTTSGLGTGLLNPKQQQKFTSMVRDHTVLSKQARFETVEEARTTLDKMHIGEPVTESADENTTVTRKARPKFASIEISTKKLRSDWHITHETLKRNLEKEKLEKTVLDGMTMRIANDMEILGIMGNIAAYGSDDTRLGRLLRRANGWGNLSENAIIVDAKGSTISQRLFAMARRKFPKGFFSNDVRWILSPDLGADYRDLIGYRATSLGDQALQGADVRPLGITMIEVPLMPTDISLTVPGNTPGWARGTEYGPFIIQTGVNDKLKIDVNNAGQITVTLSAGTWHASEIARMINETTSMPDIAGDDGWDKIYLESTTTGSTSEIDIQSVANNAYETLGLTVGANAGADSGTNDVVKEGGEIWMTDPKNLIGAFLEKTRMYKEYNKDFDRLEYVIYNELDFAIENIHALVKVKNVRLRSYL